MLARIAKDKICFDVYNTKALFCSNINAVLQMIYELQLVLGDISVISKYRDINQHDNHIVRKMLLTILSKDR